MVFWREISTEILIENVSIEQVWASLTDFDRYPEWNTFLKRLVLVGGAPFEAGTKMECDGMFGEKPMAYKFKLVAVNPKGYYFAWKGGVPVLVTGVHSFKLEQAEQGLFKAVELRCSHAAIQTDGKRCGEHKSTLGGWTWPANWGR